MEHNGFKVPYITHRLRTIVTADTQRIHWRHHPKTELAASSHCRLIQEEHTRPRNMLNTKFHNELYREPANILIWKTMSIIALYFKILPTSYIYF